MKKFFIKNSSFLTGVLALIFFVMNASETVDYLPKFSNTLLTTITYFIIMLLPVSLSIYYNNKKWKLIYINSDLLNSDVGEQVGMVIIS